MSKVIRIANGAGFLGDWLDAPRRLVERAEVDYLTIEHLAELTMSILARQREKDPDAGFAEDFLEVLSPALKQQPRLKIVANSGGMNPAACARAAARVLADADLPDVAIGCVSGDDLLPQLPGLMQRGELQPFEAEPLPGAAQQAKIVSLNAYLGARPIAAALEEGARVVITGRVADASLTVGPAMHEFGWSWEDWHKLAAATVAGHLIECGAQVTGGYSVAWNSADLTDVGYPIAELSDDGSVVITKPPGTGGMVSRRTVVEQLVYEIADPRQYLTPDVTCDFTTVEVDDLGDDRVAIRGAAGSPATNSYKASLAYRDGFMASGTLLIYGHDCREKAEACGRLILERCRLSGFELARTNIELLGYGAGVPGTWLWRKYQAPGELVLRVTAHDPRREAVDCFARQFAPLITSGPAGLAGYAAGRPAVRPVLAYCPSLVPKSIVPAQVEVRRAGEWIVR
jgi:hypothetical protein